MTTSSMKYPKYLAILIHGKSLGSYPYYIEMEMERAEDDNAPIDAWSWDKKDYGNSAEPRQWRLIRDLPTDHPLRIAYVKAGGVIPA